MMDVFSRHKKIALQFSGGRDSLATLFFLRDYWPLMTVYHTDTGDQFPETKEVVEKVKALVPHFVTIDGTLKETEERYGIPSDLLPTQSNTAIGRMHSGSKLKLIDRYECCYQSLMRPMHERMKADGITLIIRGQRDSDYVNPPMRSNQVDDGMEAFYPLQDWSDIQVDDYLNSIDVKPARFYQEGMDTTPECMSCSAWWDDKRAAYLKKHHPKEYGVYKIKIESILYALKPSLENLRGELGA
jgi:3'-phosphoadenosine 5'-phosphosulfate sulfotransferase (PAPS reductase)/FAD synthetase